MKTIGILGGMLGRQKRDATVRMKEILRIEQHVRQQSSSVELQQAVHEVAPSVTQEVRVPMHEEEESARCQLSTNVAPEMNSHILGCFDRIQQGGELAQRDDQLVKHFRQSKVG